MDIGGHTGAAEDASPARLESWKEIGAYLQRDVRTLGRWEKEEGLPIHGIDPVVGARAQAQPLPGHIVTRQLGLIAVIHAHMAIDVEGAGLLGGGLAAAFLYALRASASAFGRLGWPRPLAMAAAGLALGVVTLRYPEIVGNGREAVAALFDRPWGAGHVLALLLLRLVVTPLAVGSGTVGGVFTPTLFIGGKKYPSALTFDQMKQILASIK